MVHGAIDIGTNAVLLLIADVAEGMREILDVSTITRLGEGLIRTGELSDAAMTRTFDAVNRYAEIAREHKVERIVCYGTSALREARNSTEFIERVKTSLGWEVEVFSTRQEAYYTYLSVRSDPFMEGTGWLIIDIGGGSTEAIWGAREAFRDFVSLPVGTVKVTDLFIKHDPPQAEEIAQLSAFVRSSLQFSCPPEQVLVGMAGTMTTFGAMAKGIPFDKKSIHGMVIPLSTFDEWIERMRVMTLDERRGIPGMEPGREDLLFQGLILMREIMAHCGSSSVVVNTQGARYGVLYERAGAQIPGEFRKRTVTDAER